MTDVDVSLQDVALEPSRWSVPELMQSLHHTISADEESLLFGGFELDAEDTASQQDAFGALIQSAPDAAGHAGDAPGTASQIRGEQSVALEQDVDTAAHGNDVSAREDDKTGDAAQSASLIDDAQAAPNIIVPSAGGPNVPQLAGTNVQPAGIAAALQPAASNPGQATGNLNSARQKASVLRNIFLVDCQITAEEEAKVMAMLDRQFSKKATVDDKTKAIDFHAIDRFKLPPRTLRPCMWAGLLGGNQGEGGRNMIARVCKVCTIKKNSDNAICVWAVHVPNVDSGWPGRGADGKILRGADTNHVARLED